VGYTSSHQATPSINSAAGQRPQRSGYACAARGCAPSQRATVAQRFSSRQTLPNSTLSGTSPTHHTTKIVSGAMLVLSAVAPNAAATSTKRVATSTSSRPVQTTGVDSTTCSGAGAGRHGIADQRGFDQPTARAPNDTTITAAAA
jgi:hypothetical protein